MFDDRTHPDARSYALNLLRTSNLVQIRETIKCSHCSRPHVTGAVLIRIEKEMFCHAECAVKYCYDDWMEQNSLPL